MGNDPEDYAPFISQFKKKEPELEKVVAEAKAEVKSLAEATVAMAVAEGKPKAEVEQVKAAVNMVVKEKFGNTFDEDYAVAYDIPSFERTMLSNEEIVKMKNASVGSGHNGFNHNELSGPFAEVKEKFENTFDEDYSVAYDIPSVERKLLSSEEIVMMKNSGGGMGHNDFNHHKLSGPFVHAVKEKFGNTFDEDYAPSDYSMPSVGRNMLSKEEIVKMKNDVVGAPHNGFNHNELSAPYVQVDKE
jgi:hypothetical protein